MANRSSYYGSSSSSNTYYGSSSRSEIDMRQETIRFMDGYGYELAKGQNVLLRSLTRDSSGNKTRCNCVDLITKEPDKDRWCESCYGIGYIWVESLIKIYRVLEEADRDNAVQDKRVKPGIVNVNLLTMYADYNYTILEGDKIVEIRLNNNTGNPVTPYIRERAYNVSTVMDYRSDNGRLEYNKLFVYEEKFKYLNKPSYTEV
jgi:hypothetical protein